MHHSGACRALNPAGMSVETHKGLGDSPLDPLLFGLPGGPCRTGLRIQNRNTSAVLEESSVNSVRTPHSGTDLVSLVRRIVSFRWLPDAIISR